MCWLGTQAWRAGVQGRGGQGYKAWWAGVQGRGGQRVQGVVGRGVVGRGCIY